MQQNDKKEKKEKTEPFLKQNATLMQKMIKNQQSTYIITNNQTNNYTTNINLFLDEKCMSKFRDFLNFIASEDPANIAAILRQQYNV